MMFNKKVFHCAFVPLILGTTIVLSNLESLESVDMNASSLQTFSADTTHAVESSRRVQKSSIATLLPGAKNSSVAIALLSLIAVVTISFIVVKCLKSLKKSKFTGETEEECTVVTETEEGTTLAVEGTKSEEPTETADGKPKDKVEGTTEEKPEAIAEEKSAEKIELTKALAEIQSKILKADKKATPSKRDVKKMLLMAGAVAIAIAIAYYFGTKLLSDETAKKTDVGFNPSDLPSDTIFTKNIGLPTNASLTDLKETSPSEKEPKEPPSEQTPSDPSPPSPSHSNPSQQNLDLEEAKRLLEEMIAEEEAEAAATSTSTPSPLTPAQNSTTNSTQHQTQAQNSTQTNSTEQQNSTQAAGPK